jgi:nitrogen regulatory protein P-II 1
MQLITAIVRPGKVTDLCDALQTFGFHGITVSDASGFGKQRGDSEFYRGSEYSSGFQHRSKLEIVVRDEDVPDMVDVICSVAATGGIGDGKIWITPIRELVRIRTREAGADAL